MKNLRVGITPVAVLFCESLLLCPESLTAQTSVVVESTGASTQFYLDDFRIIQVPRDDSGIHTNFESGTTEGWVPRGGMTLTPTAADQHSGTYSLLTANRTANWQGPSINATGKTYKDSRYTVIVWVKMAPGQPGTQIRVSLQRTLDGVTNFDTIVPNTTVTADRWVRLKKTFDFIWNYDSLSVYVESNNNPTASFYIDDFDLTLVPPLVIQSDIPSVYEKLAECFPVGAAISPGDLTGPHAQLLTKHFNSITSENDMKWDATEPSEGAFNFAKADDQVAFAKAHHMRIRGHALVWHEQTPAWVFEDANGVDMSTQPFSEANKALLLQRMRNHIRTCVRHFGDLYAWDVVNEPFDENEDDGFRHSKWYYITGGPEYIDLALEYAREAVDELGLPPGTMKLYLNEYSTTVPAKRNFMLSWAAAAIERGVPIDGIGHQMHNSVNWPLNDNPGSFRDVVQTIDAFCNLGLDNQITEMDISIYRVNAPGQTIYSDYDDIVAFNQSTLIELGYRYRDYFGLFKQLKDKISSVTLWGLADDHTWRTSASVENAPLLFDNRLLAKYAYWGVVDPFKLPGADISTTVSAEPMSVLSGQIISYSISLKNNGPGPEPAADLSLTDDLPPGTVFRSLIAPTGWTCATPNLGSSGRVICNTDYLPVGASAEFKLSVTVGCGTPDGAFIVNSATAISTARNPNPVPNNTGSVTVTVSNPPPIISDLKAIPPASWPADGRMALVTLTYVVSHSCGVALVPVITITTDQEQNNQTQEPQRRPRLDWEILDPHHLLIRAEEGWRYTTTLTVTDSAGSSSSSSVALRSDSHQKRDE